MRVLVDTSIWIDHLHHGDAKLVELLTAGLVIMHPFVIGELACGHLGQRETVLDLLQGLPAVRTVSDSDLLFFVAEEKLYGKGLGLIDCHLLASCRVDRVLLWTRDKRLAGVAGHLQVALA